MLVACCGRALGHGSKVQPHTAGILYPKWLLKIGRLKLERDPAVTRQAPLAVMGWEVRELGWQLLGNGSKAGRLFLSNFPIPKNNLSTC